MADSYVCSKAKIKCSFGDKISTLTVFPDRTIWLTGQPQANISDHIPMRNIAPFGKCHTVSYPATGSATAANHGKLTPMPCVPNTPFPWMGGKTDVLLKGQPALLKSSKCKCVWGGTITLTYDGQIDGTYSELSEEPQLTQEDLDQEAKIDLSAEELLDGLQMALDAAGMVPGFGAIPDLLNACISACRGDWANAGLCLFAAIPGIGDAAGAAKLMKNGAKMAQKSKKIQKTSSGIDELSAIRAKKQAKIQQERMIEQGIAEGKVTRLETKQNVVLKKEATSGSFVEVNQYHSIQKIETTKSSKSFGKVTSAGRTNTTGNSTSYRGDREITSNNSIRNRHPQKKETVLELKKQNPERNGYELKDVNMPKDTERVKAEIKSGKNKPQFGL